MQRQEVRITLEAPKPKADAIDGAGGIRRWLVAVSGGGRHVRRDSRPGRAHGRGLILKRPACSTQPTGGDMALQSCSVAARGLWIDMLCIAHECEPYRHLTVNGKPMTVGRSAATPA